MTTPDVWAALGELVEVWRSSELITEFCAQLPANNPSTSGVPEVLRNIDAGTQMVIQHPLIPNIWAQAGQQLPLADLTVPGVREFLRRSEPIGSATECNTAWMRSRLPLYPTIPVPQLVPNGYRTTFEIGQGLFWRREALTAGLQFESLPRGVDSLLGLKDTGQADAVRRLHTALEATPEWESYRGTCERLTTDDRKMLMDARRRLKEKLTPGAVDEHEPIRAFRRSQYRREQVELSVEELSGGARALADAFEAVDELIDVVTVDVMGQLVAYGKPLHVENATDVVREGHRVTFSSNDIRPFALIEIDDPLVRDVILLENGGFRSNELGEDDFPFEGRVLGGSRRVWSDSSGR